MAGELKVKTSGGIGGVVRTTSAFKGKVNRFLDKIMGKDCDNEIPRKELLKYGIGIFGQNNSCNIMGSWFNYICIFVFGFNPLIFSILFSITRVWDAINDPIVGVIIENRVSKDGEKLRPWMSRTAIPIGILAVLMFISYGDISFYGVTVTQNVHMVFVIILYMVYDFLYSFQDIAQWGMSAMMSTNSRERAKAAQFGRIAALIGGWLPGLISPFLGISDGAGFDRKWFFLIIAVVFGFGGMAVSLFATATKERVPVPKEKQTHPFSSFSLLFKNKIVVLIVFSSLLGNITLFLQQITFFEYMMPNNKIFGIQLDGLTLSFIYGLCVGLPGSLTKPFALWTARRLGGMKNILIVSAVFNIGFRVVAFAIGYEGWRIVLSGLFIAFIGIPSQMTDIATTAIWGESLDYTEWRTGKRNEATVFAMQNASSKLSGAISTLFLGVTLRLLKFGAPYPLAVNEIFKKYAWLLFILTPAAGSLLHLIPLLFIHYDDKMKDVIEADLKYLRTLRKGGNVTIDFEYYYELYDDDEESTFNTIRW